MRAVIYARYSSDQQRTTSIDDQIRLCKEKIAREGWTLVQVYRDAAMSGATALRPGYQAMLEGAREAAFDIAIAEALDRLSRDQEDIAALFKRLQFAGIRLTTLGEGEIGVLHIGLKGTMNALFLKDLADKTRRGLRGRVEAGKSGGGNATATVSRGATAPTESSFAATGRSTPPKPRSCARYSLAMPQAKRRARSRSTSTPAAFRPRAAAPGVRAR
jgi:DNA invertase Pin-like site-specific DNA recombinase